MGEKILTTDEREFSRIYCHKDTEKKEVQEKNYSPRRKEGARRGNMVFKKWAEKKKEMKERRRKDIF